MGRFVTKIGSCKIYWGTITEMWYIEYHCKSGSSFFSLPIKEWKSVMGYMAQYNKIK